MSIFNFFLNLTEEVQDSHHGLILHKIIVRGKIGILPIMPCKKARLISKSNIFKKSEKPATFKQLTFPEMESILLNCLPRPCIGVLPVPQVISSFDNTQDLIEINVKRCNGLYQLHADGIVSFNLDFKMQFGNSLLSQQIAKTFVIET